MQTIKTSNYKFDENDLMSRLVVINQASKDAIKGKLSDNEYESFINKQLKEVNFINRIIEAKKLNIGEITIYG